MHYVRNWGANVYYSVEASWIVENKTALYFGDSITRATDTGITEAQRWTRLLSDAKGWREDNKGISGSRLTFVSGEGVPSGEIRFMQDVIKAYPDYIYVNYGINDCLSASLTGVNVIQPSTFRTKLNNLITNLKQFHSPRNIIIQTPGYCNVGTVSGIYPNYNLPRHLQFNAITRQVANHHNCRWIDSYTYFLNGGANSWLQADGLHPNVTGHVALKDCMLQFLF